MVIDKIGNINNITETNKSKPASGPRETKKNDSVQISSEAKKVTPFIDYVLSTEGQRIVEEIGYITVK